MYGSCRVCGRPLRSRASAKKRIGPGCEKRLNAAEAKMEAIKTKLEKQKDNDNFIDEIKEEIMIRKCDICGKEIRFIKRTGDKALVVNSKSFYFLPDDKGDVYVMNNGSMRRGNIAPDGLKGFTLHKC